MSRVGVQRKSPLVSGASASENRETGAFPGGMLVAWIWMTTPATAP